MKTIFLSTFAALSLLSAGSVRVDLGEAQEMICSKAHYDVIGTPSHSCAMTNPQIALDESQKMGPG